MSYVKICHIYTISCPVSNRVVYVGRTTSNPAERRTNHLCNKTNTNISRWIQQQKSQGLIPLFEVIDIAPSDDFDFWEQFYMDLFRSWGFSLLNSKEVHVSKLKKRLDKSYVKNSKAVCR